MKTLAFILLWVYTLISLAFGHPEEFSTTPSGAELTRRQHFAAKRHLAARKCAPSINAFHTERRAKRALKDQIPFSEKERHSEENIDDVMHSYTCVTAPEVEEGPYYVNNELVRQDLREDQKGISLHLDIGVIDTATCEPVRNAFVELWSANATGVYGAFEINTFGPPGSRPPPRDDPHPPHQPPDGPSPPKRGGSAPMSSSSTWLRGGYPTTRGGTVELMTIYPGFYPGRTVHVHLMVHMGYEEAENGTIISHSGSIKHVGQLFFKESWNDVVLNTTHYLGNKAHRTLNVEDHDFARATIDGSSAIVQLEKLQSSIEGGLIGFITIGIDTTADYVIHSTNYYNSSESASAIDTPIEI